MPKVKISMLLVLVALVVFYLGFLMVPATQACAACAAVGLECMVFWVSVIFSVGGGTIIAVLILAFVMRRRTKTDK